MGISNALYLPALVVGLALVVALPDPACPGSGDAAARGFLLHRDAAGNRCAP